MKTKPHISRRTALRGLGVSLALPYFEAMMPSSALALPEPEPVARLGVFYFGMGMNIRQFFPKDTGLDFTTPRILRPLEEHRGRFTVLSGISLNGWGHSGMYPFATGIPATKRQGISVDQIAAESIGNATRFPSLQLSIKKNTGFGSVALGTLSFNRQGVPLVPENDPSALFKQLFYKSPPHQRAKQADQWRRRQSVLDLVKEDAGRLSKRLGKADQKQFDQYLHSVREVEKQLGRVVQWSKKARPKPNLDGFGDFSTPIVPSQKNRFSYEAYAKLMYDLIALAFQTDSTRVVTYVVRTELQGGTYPEWGLQGYHGLSHHGNDPKKLEDMATADTHYMRHWSRLLSRLQSIREGDATLLDRSLLGFGSAMSMGHAFGPLPTMLSGGEGLGIKHQGHLKLSEKTPLANLWHTMLQQSNVPVPDNFQDNTGVIPELIG